MASLKICPSCGSENAPMNIECVQCEADLTGVAILDERGPQPVARETERQVRICECGQVNPFQVRKCTCCGEDISDIQPVATGESSPRFTLCSVDEAYTYAVIDGECCLGRDAEMREYLKERTFVSRRHATLSMVDGNLCIADCRSINHSFVNNEMLCGDKPRLLHDGDEVGLGGCVKDGERQDRAAYFIVRSSS